MSDYIRFCGDSGIPSKTFKAYPSKKHWVSNKLKDLIIQKGKAYRNQDETVRRDMERRVKRQIQLDKHSYK